MTQKWVNIVISFLLFLALYRIRKVLTFCY